MKRGLLALCFYLTISIGYSQDFPSRIWHSGWLVTDAGDTIMGNIKYDLAANSVQVQISELVIKTYSSKTIMYFKIFDIVLTNYRQFYSIPYQINSNYKASILFEVLYEGNMTLLVREKIVMVTSSSNYSTSGYYNSPSMGQSHEELAYDYFFIDKKGTIKQFYGKKNELFEILPKNNDMLQQYIKENKLHTDQMRDIVRITAFYNSL